MKTTPIRVTTSTSLPVSRKFYKELMCRVDNILKAIFNDAAPGYLESARRMIDSYLADNHDSKAHGDISPEVNIIFITLKAEIDRARERSLRARQAAQLRREARSGSTVSLSDTPCEASTPRHDTPAPSGQNIVSTNPLSSSPKQNCVSGRRAQLRWKPAVTGHRHSKKSNSHFKPAKNTGRPIAPKKPHV